MLVGPDRIRWRSRVFSAFPVPNRSNKSRTLLAGCIATAAVVVGVGAPAEGAKLGQTARTPAPACPKSPCQAVGRTTALQLVADGQRGPFKARADGRVVGWAVNLGSPNAEQRTFFGDFFASGALGMVPTARIAVLKRTSEDREYKLKAQGPVMDLSSQLGSYSVYTLAEPLRIRAGEFVGLTVPTWSTSFAVELDRTSNIWRASREDGACEAENDIKAGKAQQKVGSTRTYACDYSTARVLYWAFYEPKKAGGEGEGKAAAEAAAGAMKVEAAGAAAMKAAAAGETARSAVQRSGYLYAG